MATLEERVTNLETVVTSLQKNARAQERVLNANIREIVAYQIQTEQAIDERFDQVDQRFNQIEATMATKDDLKALATRLDERVDGLEKKMTTMETQLLDAFKQLITMVDTRLPQK